MTMAGALLNAHGRQVFPLLHYDFSTDACNDADAAAWTNSFANQGFVGGDGSIMKLVRNRNLTTCSIGMGVEANRDLVSMTKDHAGAESNLSSATLSNPLSEMFMYSSQSMQIAMVALESDAISSQSAGINSRDGVTFSLWIKPFEIHRTDAEASDTKEELSMPILTIGRRTSNDDAKNMSGATACDRYGFDFQLSYTNDQQLEMIYRTNDVFFQPCQRLLYDTSRLWNSTGAASGSIQHIAISLRNARQEIFINGKSVARQRESFDNKLKHWNATSVLQFFHHPTRVLDSQSSPWNGRLLQFSMYSGVWDESQVQKVMTEGLPPSQPYALSETIHILEDARNERGELQGITLPFLYVNGEVDMLLSSLGLVHQASAKVRPYITRFPRRGTLLDSSTGRPIEQDGRVPASINDSGDLFYIPVQNEHSTVPGATYAAFDFCVSTNRKTILASSQCVSATIFVVVDSTNDPPVAIPPSPYYVHEGMYEEEVALRLTGHDVDIDDSIAFIQISSPPRMGHFYLSVSSFRSQDTLLHGTLLSDVNHTIPGIEAYLEYRFTEYGDQVVQGSSIVDFFQFRVQDTKGSWSEEQAGEIRILTSVDSTTEGDDSSTPMLIERPGTFIPLMGVDKSGLNRTISFFIDSLPTKGAIFDSENKRVLTESILHSRESSTDKIVQVNLTYVPSVERCSGDASFKNDSFSYLVVALDQDEQIMSVSNRTEQFILFECAVEPITLQATANKTTVEAFAGSLDQPCSGYSYKASEESRISCSESAIISDFYVVENQKLSEPVLVSISSQHGLLTLNQNFLEDIVPLGDQVMRPNVRFLSKMDRLNDTLSSLHFQSEVVGEDAIRVVVEYGRCNHQAINLLDHDFSESGPGCMKAEKVLYVEVRPKRRVEEELLFRDFQWIPLPFTLFMFMAFKLRGTARQMFLRYRDAKLHHGEDSTLDLTNGIRWRQHYDSSTGHYFYEDLEDGGVTWEPPLEEEFIPSTEGDGRAAHQP